MNGKSKTWALILLAVVFLLGGVAGAATDRMLGKESAAATDSRRGSDRDRRGSYLDWLAAELDLSDGQRAQIAAIVEQQREQVSGLWREMRPRYEEVKQQARQEIQEVLNEEQRVAYQALLDREAERRRRRHNEGNR
jgi:uncharacterized membrane protein